MVFSDSLLPLAAELRTAWKKAHPGYELQISPSSPSKGETFSARTFAHGDIVEGEGDGGAIGGLGAYLELNPLLRGANFDLGALSPAGVKAFTFAGSVWGLPLRTDPFVMISNTRLLAHLGIQHPASQAWSLAEMRQAVAVARASRAIPPSAQLVAGTPWPDVRLWGAFVLGLGGRLTSASGALAFDGAPTVAATARLAQFATTGGWYADMYADPNLGVGYAATRGWGGTVAHTLFSIQPNSFLTRGGGAVTAPEDRFPVLPVTAVIPAYSTRGLMVPRNSSQPETAVQFMLWLYQPAQQGLLMDTGIAPVVVSPSVLAAWTQVRPDGHEVSSVFDPQAMLDVLAALLPMGGALASQDYDNFLVPALLKSVSHPSSTKTYLQGAQDAIQKVVATEAAQNRRALAAVR